MAGICSICNIQLTLEIFVFIPPLLTSLFSLCTVVTFSLSSCLQTLSNNLPRKHILKPQTNLKLSFFVSLCYFEDLCLFPAKVEKSWFVAIVGFPHLYFYRPPKRKGNQHIYCEYNVSRLDQEKLKITKWQNYQLKVTFSRKEEKNCSRHKITPERKICNQRL